MFEKSERREGPGCYFFIRDEQYVMRCDYSHLFLRVKRKQKREFWDGVELGYGMHNLRTGGVGVRVMMK